jgi:Secretion system C-terminal sorting domain
LNFYCKSQRFSALWIDQINPSNNLITWQYGAYIEEDGVQPHNRKRNLKISNNLPANVTETWIKVTYNHPNCTSQPLTYTHKIKLNASFTLDGTYASQSVGGILAQYMNVVPAGNYTVRLASPSGPIHLWEELQPNGTYTILPQWISNTMDFTMPAYPNTGTSKTFRVTVPNSCGTGSLVRTIWFSSNANPWGLVNPHGNGSVSPNPSTGLFRLNTDQAFEYSSQLEQETPIIQQVELYNSLGQFVSTLQGSGSPVQDVDISDFPDGIYQAVVRTDQGNLYYSLLKSAH